MDVELIEQDQKNKKIVFLLKNTSPAFANMLRKTIIDEVPTMAIEDVEVRKNSSVLYDEIIAHRLGLIPIVTDLDGYIEPADCKCDGEGCSKCQLMFSLKSKGPCYVYASDLVSNDPKVVPAFPKIPIVKLIKGQTLELEAVAVIGKGIEHAKWTPGFVFYKYKPFIEIKKGVEDANAVADSCPVDVFKLKGNELAINDANLLKCHLCGACTDIDPDHIKLNESDSEFIFTIESFGQLSPEDIVSKAVELIGKKANNLIKIL